ncbi:hypothetical protein PoB_001504100 [Plakobranchus ocellatus]|uniref:Uncharacterized protein n=1 Tax=Plakobranchus ocellatus TaxID=259542 RepID=A0AAV3YMR4_9GAST|nr:hypothetical protein PoB_001504100 [Plakobranchus ocellatus]
MRTAGMQTIEVAQCIEDRNPVIYQNFGERQGQGTQEVAKRRKSHGRPYTSRGNRTVVGINSRSKPRSSDIRAYNSREVQTSHRK